MHFYDVQPHSLCPRHFYTSVSSQELGSFMSEIRFSRSEGRNSYQYSLVLYFPVFLSTPCLPLSHCACLPNPFACGLHLSPSLPPKLLSLPAYRSLPPYLSHLPASLTHPPPCLHPFSSCLPAFLTPLSSSVLRPSLPTTCPLCLIFYLPRPVTCNLCDLYQ